MTEFSRRKFLCAATALIAAPAVIRIPGLLMPVKNRMTTVALSDRGDVQAVWDAGAHAWMPLGGMDVLQQDRILTSLPAGVWRKFFPGNMGVPYD